MAPRKTAKPKSARERRREAERDVRRNGVGEQQMPVPTSVKVKNGVVLRVKPVPRYVLRALLRKYPEPEVPVVEIADKGRTEENPNDPEYRRQRLQWIEQIGDATNNALLTLGTEVESVPKGMDRPEDETWAKRLKVVGIDVPAPDEDDNERYLAWLRYYVIQDDIDLTQVAQAVMRRSGTPMEPDVEKSMSSFPGREARGGHSESAAEEDDQDGDSVRP